MYGYNELKQDIALLKLVGYDVFNIGRTLMGFDIPAVHTGKYDAPQVIIIGAMHAREHIVSKLLIDMIAEHTPQSIGIWYIPMVNIDGVRIATEGTDWIGDKTNRAWINSFGDTQLWKANIRGVDLNVNYPRGWGTGFLNKRTPSAENFIGRYPLSETESAALAMFTLNIKPLLTISYHCKGEVIYWEYGGDKRYKAYADEFANETGYTLVGSEGSAGGYKDWYMGLGLGMGLTIEVGDDTRKHPYPYSDYENIYKKTMGIPALCESVVKRISYGFYEASNKRGYEGKGD